MPLTGLGMISREHRMQQREWEKIVSSQKQNVSRKNKSRGKIYSENEYYEAYILAIAIDSLTFYNIITDINININI